MLQGVIETKAFLGDADDAGMSDDEREAVVDQVSANPETGDKMSGTGGCRKFRAKKPGTGKSGGYRIVSWYDGPDIPVFLLTVFGKNERANLTQAERNALKKLTATLRESLRKKK